MGSAYWDNIARKYKTTGYSDFSISYFDQLMRLKVFELLIKKYLAGATLKMNMLDFGCGCGDFAQYFSSTFNKIYAYDSSSEILKIAESRIASDNVKVIPSLNLVDEKLDLTISVTVLQHIIDDEELLSTIRDIGSKSNDNSYFLCLETVKCPDYNISQPSYLKEREADNYVRVFEKSGYRVEDVLSFYNPYFIPSESLLFYKRKLGINNALYKIFRKAGVKMEFINNKFRTEAETLLSDSRNIDGIVNCESFSKIFICKKTSRF